MANGDDAGERNGRRGNADVILFDVLVCSIARGGGGGESKISVIPTLGDIDDPQRRLDSFLLDDVFAELNSFHFVCVCLFVYQLCRRKCKIIYNRIKK